MNIEELKNNKISDLSTEQIESRIEFLLTLSDEEILEYLTYILDVEYISTDICTIPEIGSDIYVENFISDFRFKKFRDLIFDEAEDVSEE